MFNRWLSIKSPENLLLLGPRRSGKTTFVKRAFPEYTYSTLDDLDLLHWARSDAKGFVSSLGKRAIIDEVQRMPELSIAVKYAIDNEGASFVMTGSSSMGLTDSAADTLAGRIYIVSLPTACFGEADGQPDHNIFTDTVPPPVLNRGQRLLERAVEYGQFPEVETREDDRARHDLLNKYKNTYFTRDLMQLAHLENLEGLLAIFHNLARSVGSHLEVSNFARESGLSHITAKKYLNTLFQSQLAFKLYGYQYSPAKRYIKAAKSYFADNGIIHGLNIRMSEGQRFENFVIAELEKRRKIGFIETEQFYYFKSAGGAEVDLVFETEDEVYAVEIKSSIAVKPRDLQNLKRFANKDGRPVRRYLFNRGTEYADIDGVRVIPAAALYRGK